ncbi:T9SS type A sorting domain-containing protein [bacterium]|nr:T9SS type A sorting domain-containing protein [bacterium]
MLTSKKFILAAALIFTLFSLGNCQPPVLIQFHTLDTGYVNHPISFYFGGTTPNLAQDGWLVQIIVDGGDGIQNPANTDPSFLGDPTPDDFFPLNNNFYTFTINGSANLIPGGFIGEVQFRAGDNVTFPEPAANFGDQIYLRVFSDTTGNLTPDDWYTDSGEFYTIPTSSGDYGWINWPGPDFQLPVEMLSFEAVPGDGKATLTWVTASEIDNKEFHLYRDGVYVATVPTQAQGGSSTTELTYTYVDFGLNNGQEYSYTLKVVDINGNIASLLMEASVTPMVGATGITVTAYDLRQNYPNPFNPVTTIEYDVLETGNVHLNVYNISGQKVATLLNGMQQNGGMRYSVEFDAQDLPSGIYFYTVKVNNFSDTKKLVLLR